MTRTTIARFTTAVALGATVLVGMPTLALADTTAELEAKLEEANTHLSTLYDEAAVASEQVIKTTGDLEQTEADIEAKQAELTQAQDTLAERIHANYKTGGVSLISIILESASFDDFVSRVIYAAKVSESDAEVIASVREIQSELDEKLSEQQQLLEDQTAQQAELDAKVAEAESYVSSLDSQVQAKLAEEQAALAAEQAELQAAAQAEAEQNGGTYAAVEETATATTDDATEATDEPAAPNDDEGSDEGDDEVETPSQGAEVDDSADSGSSSGGSLTQSQRNAIVSAAWAKVGCAYVYGGTGPSSYDCSGFVQYCYAAAGISLPRTSYDQGACGTTTSNPQAGDIVCYGGHVGIYLGGGMMIDAGNESTGVIYRAVYGSPWYQTL